MIKNEHPRDPLQEGRDYGVGFAFLNKKRKYHFVGLNAFTACKDYLNDIIYIERTKKPLEEVYGFKHELVNFLDKKRYFFMGVTPLDHNHSLKKWTDYEKCNELLKDNNKNLVELLNQFEEFLGIKSRTTFEHIEDSILVLRAPIFWSKYPFLISLYTLLIRCFISIQAEDFKKDIKETIKNYKKCLIPDDKYYTGYASEFLDMEDLNIIYNYKFPEKVTNAVSQIHNSGIKDWVAVNRKYVSNK